jgi:hypothetical protein
MMFDVPTKTTDIIMFNSRIIGVRGKLWELSKSRKIRLDPFELAAAALALRLRKCHINLHCPSNPGRNQTVKRQDRDVSQTGKAISGREGRRH